MKKTYSYQEFSVTLVSTMTEEGCSMNYEIFHPVIVPDGVYWETISSVITREDIGLVYIEDLASTKIEQSLSEE